MANDPVQALSDPLAGGSPAAEMAAQRLREAYSGKAVAPLRDLLRPDDLEGAYAAQAINTAIWRSQGRRVVGRKIGLTSREVQMQLGVDRPDFGILFDDMQIANGSELSPGRLIQGRAEAEVALILGRDVERRNASFEDLFTAVEYALPAIEIVDSRIAEWAITFADTVADNGSSAFFVLGNTPVPLDRLDLAECEMELRVNGEVVSRGRGSSCLGHPLNAAAWLARTLAERGEPLRAGDIILTGALGPLVTLRPGTQVTAKVSGLGSAGFRMGCET